MFGNGIGTRARTCSCTLWRAATVFIGDRGADMAFAPPSESRNTAVRARSECHTRPNLTGFLSKIISLFARTCISRANWQKLGSLKVSLMMNQTLAS